jgi:hypothetical protein
MEQNTVHSKSIISSQSLSSSSLEQILVAVVVAYDTSQIRYLERGLFAGLEDLCVVSGIKQVDVVIYTTVVWTQLFVEEWEESNTLPCGTISISIKDPPWKLNLVKFHRDKLFYDPQVLLEYNLFVYTEEDMLLKPRNFLGFCRETKQLEEFLGSIKSATGYSIGYMRFQWQNGNDNLQSSTNGDVQLNPPSLALLL